MNEIDHWQNCRREMETDPLFMILQYDGCKKDDDL